MEDLDAMIQQELNNLTKQKTDLQKQIAEVEKKMLPLEAYFKAKTGTVPEGKRRGRRKKTAENVAAPTEG